MNNSFAVTTRMHTLKAKGQTFTISFPDDWTIRPAGFWGRLAGTVVDFDSPDGGIHCNIIAGRSMGIDSVNDNERFFYQRTPPNDIIEVDPVTVAGKRHFAAVYRRTGMIHKRYAVIHQGIEFAIVCSSGRYDAADFMRDVVPICDKIVESMKFKTD